MLASSRLASPRPASTRLAPPRLASPRAASRTDTASVKVAVCPLNVLFARSLSPPVPGVPSEPIAASAAANRYRRQEGWLERA